MWVGRYTDGRDITYDEETSQFAVGSTSVTIAQVLEYDAFEQIEWTDDATREWVRGLSGAAVVTCGKCGGAMERGRLLGNVPVTYKSEDAARQLVGKDRPLIVHRCVACSHVELYAGDEAFWAGRL